MLPSPLRLNRLQSSAVVKFGRRISRLECTFWIQIPASSSSSQFVVQVPKKNIRLATRRNRIRRLLHESLRLLTPRFKQSAQIVIRVNGDRSFKKRAEIDVMLINVLNSLHLL